MADAIALVRPRVREKILPFLDLDEGEEESDGIYAEELSDGAFLLHTFQPYEVFANDPDEAATWLEVFGDALPDIHDDARGMLFFPDDVEPDATTYEAVVTEVGERGQWTGGSLTLDALASAFSPEQLQSLQSLAQGSGSSFEIGQLLQGVQQQLMDALQSVSDEGEASDDDEDDDEKKPAG